MKSSSLCCPICLLSHYDRPAALDDVLKAAAAIRHPDKEPAPKRVVSIQSSPVKQDLSQEERRQQLLQQYGNLQEDEDYMPAEGELPVYKKSKKRIGIPDGIGELLISLKH